MTAFVLDASVALCWCFADQNDTYAEAVRTAIGEGARPVVAFVWPLEIGQALARAERDSKLSAAEVQAWAHYLAGPPIEVDGNGLDRSLRETLTLARVTGLSTYDAAYLELAEREQMPLATLDLELKRAAKRRGVPVFAPAG